MFLDVIEPTSQEEFDYIKEQLGSRWHPALRQMKYGEGRVLNQIAKIMSLSEEKLEKIILTAAEEATTKQLKRDLMYYRLSLCRSAKELEEITNIPMRKLERKFLMKLGFASFLATLKEMLRWGVAMFLLFISVLPPGIVILIPFIYVAYCVIKLMVTGSHPVADRLAKDTYKIIGGGDKRWRY